MLTANVADAVIAYLAGPRFVTRVARTHGDVREKAGDGPWVTRPPSSEDRAEVQETLELFFSDLDLPAPPSHDEWRLHLPEGVSEKDFRATVEDLSIPAYDATNGREVLAELERRLAKLLGGVGS